MKIRDFGLLTDENINPAVVVFLRLQGFDVVDVAESGLRGRNDTQILKLATGDNRVVVTHDPDFGKLAILGGEKLVGIVYLRPGHIRVNFTKETITTLLALDPDVAAPFILVASRSGSSVKVRVRSIVP